MSAASSPREKAIVSGRRALGQDWAPDDVAEAPGRLELIGNHVDYNGGLVLAGAIDRHVAAVVRVTGGEKRIQIVAADVSSAIVTLIPEECRDWSHESGATGAADYARGVIASLLFRDLAVRERLQIAISGNVPIGFGMSSSAGLCVALVMTLSPDELDSTEIVAIAREAEHRCGSPVGAMDQSASVAGGVILFDGRDTNFTTLKPELGNYVFAVADSGITHALGASSYPVRVAESREALGIIQSCVGPDLASLGELTPGDWTSVKPAISNRLNPVLQSRVEHVVTEVERVRHAVDAIQASDWETFGQLMTASGRSSNEYYEVSHPKVEELVKELLAIEGVAGARMMGGGEGGPALALIHRDAIPFVAETLERGYFRNNPSHLVGDRLQACSFGPGASKRPL